MNPMRQLRCDEYLVAQSLAHYVKKKEYSLNIPLDPQQKGFDLLVHSNLSGKSATIQIKGSKRYRAKTKDAKGQARDHRLWFKRFTCERGSADFYCLVGIYPLQQEINPKSICHCGAKILMLSEKDMRQLLDEVHGDHMYFEFSETNKKDVCMTRGIPGKRMERFVIQRAIKDLIKFLH